MSNVNSDAPVFMDPAIPRKSSIINETLKIQKLPLPSVVEISESGTCNPRAFSFKTSDGTSHRKL